MNPRTLESIQLAERTGKCRGHVWASGDMDPCERPVYAAGWCKRCVAVKEPALRQDAAEIRAKLAELEEYITMIDAAKAKENLK